MTDRDDEAWRAIVDNYGDRADLHDDPPGRRRTDDRSGEAAPGPADDRADEPAPAEPAPGPAPREQGDEAAPRAWNDEGHFVPPPPPPLPYVAPARLTAWAGLVAAPVVLLLSVVADVTLAGWVGLLLLGWFVGGFAYLVSRMKQSPDDPWDDGARL